MEETIETIETLPTKKTTYTEAQKRAIKKYRENNRDKVNAQRKIYYEHRKARDPEFLVYKKNKAKEYYHKMKEYKKNSTEDKKDIIDDSNSVISVIDELPKLEEPIELSYDFIDEYKQKIDIPNVNKHPIFCRNK